MLRLSIVLAQLELVIRVRLAPQVELCLGSECLRVRFWTDTFLFLSFVRFPEDLESDWLRFFVRVDAFLLL
jgi:hypothetical protein